MIHLILDHSALIPCGSKPEEEKTAIIQLADLLPDADAVWHVTAHYLRVLRGTARPKWRQHRSQGLLAEYPRLIRGLERTLDQLLLAAKRDKKLWCTLRRLKEATRLKLHILGRNALHSLPRDQQRAIQETARSQALTREDTEILALALKTAAKSKTVLVTTDTPLLEAAKILQARLHLQLEAYMPSKALPIIQAATHG